MRAFTVAVLVGADLQTKGNEKRERVDNRDSENGDDPEARIHAEQQQRAECAQNDERPKKGLGIEAHGYFSSTREPRIFWLLNALRKLGTSRSINSKYDDNAGVFCCALQRISSL